MRKLMLLTAIALSALIVHELHADAGGIDQFGNQTTSPQGIGPDGKPHNLVVTDGGAVKTMALPAAPQPGGVWTGCGAGAACCVQFTAQRFCATCEAFWPPASGRTCSLRLGVLLADGGYPRADDGGLAVPFFDFPVYDQQACFDNPVGYNTACAAFVVDGGLTINGLGQ
jgi:hypothetical protein